VSGRRLQNPCKTSPKMYQAVARWLTTQWRAGFSVTVHVTPARSPVISDKDDSLSRLSCLTISREGT